MDLVSLRKKINDFLLGTNNIDKLMTEKVNDYILIEEQPLPIKIGDRTIFIGNLTIENNYKYWYEYGKILANIGCKFLNFDLMNDSAEIFRHLHLHKRLYKDLSKLIDKTILKQQAYYLTDKKVRKELKWKNCNYGYFKKHVTMEKLIQILKLVYLYNFDAEKKNFKILFPKMAKEDQAQELMQTYCWSWLVNLAGVTGNFQLARLTNVDYWEDESQSEIRELKVKK
jgi:hypothetical protein